MEEPQDTSGESQIPQDETELWKSFLKSKDPDIRAVLINQYIPMARHIAASMFSRRPFPELEFSDYLQYARVGLIEAIDRYQPDRGASFSTYAGYRIKGSILNGIENNSEMTAQSAHRWRLQKERALSLHEGEDRHRHDDVFTSLARTAIDLALGYVLEDEELDHMGQSSGSDDLYASCELKRIRERLLLIVEALPERERFIVKGHYFDHMEFKALAEQLGVTKAESRSYMRGVSFWCGKRCMPLPTLMSVYERSAIQ